MTTATNIYTLTLSFQGGGSPKTHLVDVAKTLYEKGARILDVKVATTRTGLPQKVYVIFTIKYESKLPINVNIIHH